jgi:hypothetical protein
MPKITIPSIDTLAQEAVDMLLQSGSHEPLLFIFTLLENIVAPIAFMPDSTDAKQMVMKAIAHEARKQCKSRALTDIFMVTEAWMLKTEKGEEDLGNMRVSEHPNRVEVLIVTHLNVRQNKSGMRMYEMKRDSKGNLIEIVASGGSSEPYEVRSYLLEAFVAGWNMKPLS